MPLVAVAHKGSTVHIGAPSLRLHATKSLARAAVAATVRRAKQIVAGLSAAADAGNVDHVVKTAAEHEGAGWDFNGLAQQLTETAIAAARTKATAAAKLPVTTSLSFIRAVDSAEMNRLESPTNLMKRETEMPTVQAKTASPMTPTKREAAFLAKVNDPKFAIVAGNGQDEDRNKVATLIKTVHNLPGFVPFPAVMRKRT